MDLFARFTAAFKSNVTYKLKRADRSLFARDTEIELLIENCGGHPRELLRLLKLCCELAEQDCIAPQS